MKGHFGVWIDHEQAWIVAAGQDTVTVVQSDVRGHTRFTGGGGYPGGDSSQGGGSERRHEERHRNELNRYLDAVVAALGHAEELLIFGPGEAKRQLAERLRHSKARPLPTIAMETSDKLTEAQVVAKVSQHFDVLHTRKRAP